jgi:hypothetical protein
MEATKFPVILSFDVGVIHLSYCLLTKKIYNLPNGQTREDWDIIDWNNIDLTCRDETKCHCGAKAKLYHIIDNESKYYCKVHGRKANTDVEEFDKCYLTNTDKNNKCVYQCSGDICNKNAKYHKDNIYYCTTHAKQLYKNLTKEKELKPFKNKNSNKLNFDDVKYDLIMELEKRRNLLSADCVVIENQPSFKNPRMKSIASTLYDYYLMRGVIDKETTKSNITKVKFMSPSNKLKLANEGDMKQLIKVKSSDDTKAYKLTKSLGIKYCTELINHLPNWLKHFNSHKKKDDLADSFLQGAYYYLNNITTPKKSKSNKTNDNEIEV